MKYYIQIIASFFIKLLSIEHSMMMVMIIEEEETKVIEYTLHTSHTDIQYAQYITGQIPF